MNPALRVMADIDILVKKTQSRKIRNILATLNYTSNYDNASDDFYQKYPYEILFSKKLTPNMTFFLELHHTLASARPHKFDLPYLWERVSKINLNQQKLFHLSAEDNFLSLAIHLRRHTRRITLKFIVDIAELLNKEKAILDWSYIKKSAKNNFIMTPVYLSLYLAKEILESTVSLDTIKEFQPNIIKTYFIQLTINKFNFFSLKKWQGVILRILLFDNLLDFFIYLWKVAFLERLSTKFLIKKQRKTIKRIPVVTEETIKK
jgi:hypothetical protein